MLGTHSYHLPPQSPKLTNQDYHVILIHKAATTTTKSPSSTVYDFDTTLHPFGLQFESYVSKTLYGDKGLWANPDDQEAVLSYVAKHLRGFRLVAAEEYIRLFASTRKHMMKKCADESSDADGGWLTKPPDYPPIRTEGRDLSFCGIICHCFCWVTKPCG